jgi:hypothetical protein
MRKLWLMALFAVNLAGVAWLSGSIRADDPCVEYTTESACDVTKYEWELNGQGNCETRVSEETCNLPRISANKGNWVCKGYNYMGHPKTRCADVEQQVCATKDYCDWNGKACSPSEKKGEVKWEWKKETTTNGCPQTPPGGG